ncbi:MAG: S-layer protein domain-containing protein [Candidatus Methanoperedens sp.]|nr:S-layer protein domain-containing protein [Candidatus Methanoperedens sp.]
MFKNKICTGHTLRIGLTILILLTAVASAAPASTGNRIWDKSKGMPTTYTWNPYSFAGFYYNLDENLGTEELKIRDIKRNIDEGDIVYRTSPMEVSFGYSGFGKFQVIGFMADKYFAGYTGNSIISNKETKSALGSKQLHKILMDDDDKRVVSEGGTLTLREGYVLQMKEVDISAGPGQVWVTLLKNGDVVDDDVISGNDLYVYSKKVGSESDMPIIAVHFDSVFRGREVNAAFIKGVFQISESFTPVETGDRYGEMEISSVGAGVIEMTNRNSIGLSAGNTIDLMGDLKIIVADSSNLRFALSVERAGIFEARGTIYPTASEWTPMNFGLNIGGTNIGFYYDMDQDIGTENLKVETISGSSIPEGRLKYSTSAEEINFDYSGFGKYQVIGFMAEKYFAGYTGNSIISNKDTKSTLGSRQLHKVLLDDDIKRTIAQGGTLTLREGYVLQMKEVDTGAGPGQVWVVLLKDGKEVDSDVVSGNDAYIYTTNAGGVKELPTIAVHFDSVFRGREVNAAFIKGIFQISETFTPVGTGDRYGQMEITTVGADGIQMKNHNSVGLSSGSTVDVMGNIKFKVADSSTLRFYPFVTVSPEMIANQLLIDAPARATAGDAVNIKVTAGGKPVDGASVGIDSDTGLTDKDGIIKYTLQKSMKGIYNITATKLGYQKASKGIEVQAYIENKLSIEAPAKANQFETITIRVTINGTPVKDAAVVFDNTTAGQTDGTGTLRYVLNESGTHTIYASKSGYATAARDISVALPFAEFKSLDISTSSDVVFTGQQAVIRSNVTNTGTKTDTLPVVLIINSTEVESKPVTLAPKETKEVTFKYNVALPAGNYTVEVLGQKKQIEVRESGVSVLSIIGIIIGLIGAGVIIIYLLTKKSREGSELAGKAPGKPG